MLAWQRDGWRGSHGLSAEDTKTKLLRLQLERSRSPRPLDFYTLYWSILATSYCRVTWRNVGHTGEGEGEEGDDDKLSLEPHLVQKLKSPEASLLSTSSRQYNSSTSLPEGSATQWSALPVSSAFHLQSETEAKYEFLVEEISFAFVKNF